jgi:glycosyltransferase involved in cell wall biosynthesis
LDKNLGKGAALLIGFSNVSKKADIIGFIDADLDISPSCIKKMISDLVKDNTDMAIGSKYHPDSQVSISLRRKILSQIYRILMQALIGLNVSDTQTGVKFFKRDFLTIILSHEFHTESFAFDIELLLLASKNQIRILEHPVEMKKQFNSSVGIQNGLKALRDLVVIRRSNS